MRRFTLFIIGFSLSLLLGCTPSSTPESESLNQPPPIGDSDQGKALFERQVIGQQAVSGCSNCHSTDPNSQLVGPSLPNLANYDADYLTEGIVDPNGPWPEGFSGGMIDSYPSSLTDQEIADLVAYLQTFAPK